MSKELDDLFKQDNKRIDDSIQAKLNDKINKTIKNRSLLKGFILIVVAIIGAAIFSGSLSLVIP